MNILWINILNIDNRVRSFGRFRLYNAPRLRVGQFSLFNPCAVELIGSMEIARLSEIAKIPFFSFP